MKNFIKHIATIMLISLTLQSCTNKKYILGDGHFTMLRKYIFPLYELEFPKISAENSHSKYNVNKLIPVRSLLGIKLGVANKKCIDYKSTKLKNMHLKLILLNQSNEIIVETDAKLEDWIWSYSYYNPVNNNELNYCYLYMPKSRYRKV